MPFGLFKTLIGLFKLPFALSKRLLVFSNPFGVVLNLF